MPPEKRIRPGDRIPFSRSIRERDLIIARTEANHCHDVRVRRVLEGVHDRLVNLEQQYTDEEQEPTLAQFPQAARKKFTARQGQYLAFIYYYTKIHGVPPAEADFQQYFKVSPPVVHQMILTLAARGLIDRVPGRPRSIRLRLGRDDLPDLE
jgi:DNA-binding MarR family transcriptional regulator